MPNIITDKKSVSEILERGVENIYPNEETLEKLLSSGKRIKLYCGFDPSAPALHIGNAIAINKLSQFQELGHEVIFLIGDFTGMIGDPTDKTAARKKMTREEVLENAKNFQKQAEAFLKFDGENPAEVLYNSQWSDKVTFKDLIEITSNFTVQQLIQRDMFQERIKNEKPIYLHEFLYPIAQGYDCVAMDVDFEIGGNDQTFNMLAGRDLMKAMKGKEKCVLTLKLLADNEGKKMGKSEGNAVFLDQDAFRMFENIMNWSDGVIGIGFELCTKLSLVEARKIQKGLEDGILDPRETKMRLAHEFVKLVHGEEKAKEAQEKYEKVAKSEIPENIPEYEVEWCEPLDSYQNIIDYIVSAGLAKSKSDARRKIEQGGVSIDGEKTIDVRILTKDDDGKVLRVGKSDFVKIKFD
jgi:tyrosyl-tRNA synthetase